MNEESLRNTPILVVDDLPAARRIVTRMLDILGFRNFQEASGKSDALAKIKEKEFKIAITDLHLKDGLGTDLISVVHGDPGLERHGLAFIIITSDMDKGSFQEALKAGISSYLLKPFSPQVLEERIMLCLHKR